MTDRPAMTEAVDLGCKATKTKKKNSFDIVILGKPLKGIGNIESQHMRFSQLSHQLTAKLSIHNVCE